MSWRSGLAGLACCLLLSACEQDWSLRLVSAGDAPVFTLDHDGWFRRLPVELSSLDFEEVRADGSHVADAWSVSPNLDAAGPDRAPGRVQYGVTPHGWKVDKPVQTLKPLTWYSVNSRFYLWRKQNGEYVVLGGDEFARRHGCIGF